MVRRMVSHLWYVNTRVVSLASGPRLLARWGLGFRPLVAFCTCTYRGVDHARACVRLCVCVLFGGVGWVRWATLSEHTSMCKYIVRGTRYEVRGTYARTRTGTCRPPARTIVYLYTNTHTHTTHTPCIHTYIHTYIHHADAPMHASMVPRRLHYTILLYSTLQYTILQYSKLHCVA